MLPLLPGVYIIRDKAGEIIYIGKAKRLRTRVSQYFREGVPHDAKVTKMISHAFEFDVIVTQSEFEALVLECSQIKQHKPKYNILLKDDQGLQLYKGHARKMAAPFGGLQKDDENAGLLRPLHLQLCRARNGGGGLRRVPPAAVHAALPAGYRQRAPMSERAHRQVHGPCARAKYAMRITARPWKAPCT